MKNEREIQALLKLQRTLDDLKAEKARTEGELDSLMKQMEKIFHTTDAKEAEEKLSTMRAHVEHLRNNMQASFTALQKEMEK